MNFEERTFGLYRGKRILLDANLLLLLFMGSFERARIGTFKRTAAYSPSDFDSLGSLLLQFRTIVTTPHILTEVSNLSNSLPEYLKTPWFDHFSDQTKLLQEIFEPASLLMEETSFNPFGLTDAAIHKAANDTLILTEDFRLTGYLRAQGLPVLNFNDLRQMAHSL